MERNRIIRIIITIIIIAGIGLGFWYYNHKKNSQTTSPDLSVSAYDQTQNTDATKVTAHPKDVIVYTLSATNPSDKVIPGYVMEVAIGGVTNSATLIDAQGANYNSGNNSLVWTPLDIPANSSIQKQFTVRVKDTLPSNASDKVLKVTFSNEVDTSVDYSSVASNTNTTSRPGTIGSGATYKAPKTGIPGWISFYLAVFLTFGVLLFRTARKMGTPRN